ncbi:MAG: hypothetical protein J3R72DRAFT_250132 [Linnemannia gamsii]|nr:MAG: hypothetical protein J3R72DRAFT_250132 [Linnemannia gamsii]
MARNSDAGFRNGSPQKQEPPTFQVPLSIALKARPRPNQQDSRDKNSNNDRDKDEDEDGEEEFRILQYPGEPWGRASRSRSSALIPSRRLISALIEDTRLATDSQDSTDTSRNRRNRRTNNNTRRVSLLLKRPRSLSITTASIATESSDDSGSTFHRKKPAASSTKKRPTKQQRLRQHSHSDDSTTTPATIHLAVQKSRGRPPARRTITMPEEESEGEEVGVIAVDEDGSEDEVVVANDSADDTYQSNYIPGQRTISPQQQQQERFARSRKRSMLLDDEDEGQAAGVQEQEQEQELGQAVEMPETKPSVRYIERMDCVLIPVIDIVEKRSLVRRNRDGAHSAASVTPTGRVATKDTNKYAEKEDESRTMSTVPKDTTSTTQVRNLTPTTSSRLGPRKDPVVTPEIDVDTPRQTRSDVRRSVAVKLEPTTTATAKSTPPKDIEPPQKTTTNVKPPRKAIKDVPGKPLPSGVQAKTFHGWWLKRKEGLAQEGNLGILVQGNMLEPKVMVRGAYDSHDVGEQSNL